MSDTAKVWSMRASWIGRIASALLLSLALPTGLGAQLTAREGEAMLEAHNRWRAEHQAPPLAWSSELARYAQAWAETLVRRHPGELLHSDDGTGTRPEAKELGYGGWGENLYWGSAVRWTDGRTEAKRDLPAEHVVDSWGSEVEWYDFVSGECSPAAEHGCGHFTQMVWRTSTHVGCGRAFGSDDAQVWACSYDPPGNFVGEHQENVLAAVRR